MSVRVRYSSELYHHGVKDQKWGVRRYQNEDGSYTPLGRIHYGIGKGRKAVSNAASAAATKVKNVGSAATEKARSAGSAAKVRARSVGSAAVAGISNAGRTAGQFVKTNAPIAAKATGRALGNAAKATGKMALAGGAAAGAIAAANAPKVGRAIKRTAANYTPSEIRSRRAQKLREKASYDSAIASAKRAKYDRKYAKKNAKEQRKMNRWRYKEEKRKNTILGKAKRSLMEIADVGAKLTPIALMFLTMKVGGGFNVINQASKPMAEAFEAYKKNPIMYTTTAEGNAVLKQLVASNRKLGKGVVNLSSLRSMADTLSGGNSGLADDIFRIMEGYA